MGEGGQQVLGDGNCWPDISATNMPANYYGGEHQLRPDPLLVSLVSHYSLGRHPRLVLRKLDSLKLSDSPYGSQGPGTLLSRPTRSFDTLIPRSNLHKARNVPHVPLSHPLTLMSPNPLLSLPPHPNLGSPPSRRSCAQAPHPRPSSVFRFKIHLQ